MSQSNKPLIHFAHANGIPSAVYRKLLAQLKDEYDVVTLPVIGTDPRYPVTNHWDLLVEQLIASIESQNQGRKVIALGHSLGSLLSLMAAYKRPDLMTQVIMLDPPLIAGLPSLAIHLAKIFKPDYIDKVTPAGLSAKRRDHWDSREQAAQSLRPRGLFADFDQDCFDDYIRYGLQDDPQGGVTLTIPKAVEVAVFRNNPSMFWLKPRRPPAIPAHLVAGAQSQFYARRFPQRIKRQMGIPYSLQQGGHMFPLEHPLEVAATVKKIILQQQR